MTIQITDQQSTNATASSTDADSAYATGIKNTSNVEVSPPISGYTLLSTPIRDTIKAAIKGLYAIFSRYFDTISASSTLSSTNVSISNNSEQALVNVNVISYVPRKVQITLNVSTYSSVVGTTFLFYPKVNGVAITPALPRYIGIANDHAVVSGTWIVDLAAGSNKIQGIIAKTSVGGVVTFDFYDYFNMTVIG